MKKMVLLFIFSFILGTPTLRAEITKKVTGKVFKNLEVKDFEGYQTILGIKDHQDIRCHKYFIPRENRRLFEMVKMSISKNVPLNIEYTYDDFLKGKKNKRYCKIVKISVKL